MIFVSVIIPVYNRTDLLIRAVRSVLDQSHSELELIVVDDGSNPPVADLLKNFSDSRLRVLRQEHSGVASARNLGIQSARAEWIALLDSDDYWLPPKLVLQLQYLNEHPEMRVAQCPEIWYRKGQRVNMRKEHEQPEGDIFARSLELCVISSSSVMVQSSLYKELGGYDIAMRVCEDYDFWLRVTLKNRVGLVQVGLEKLPLVVKHGGHADQLSHSEPALDRYRVYALAKLLLSDGVSSAQRQLILERIAAKSSVLASGARKRGLFERADLYGRLCAIVCSDTADHSSNEVALFSLTQIVQELRAEIRERVER